MESFLNYNVVVANLIILLMISATTSEFGWLIFTHQLPFEFTHILAFFIRIISLIFIRSYGQVLAQNLINEEKIRRESEITAKNLAQTTHQLQKANIRLQELGLLKDEFVSIASHELRTPMTIIKNYLWLVLSQADQKLKPKPKKNLERAYLSTERLIRLVKDMLTVSRIEGKRLEINPSKFDLGSLCRQLLEEFKSKAEEKQLKLVFAPQKQTFIVTADKDKIREALLNLLGNALKFTPPHGQITIDLQKEGHYLNTSISDTGQGINPEDQTRLFQKFARLNNAYTGVAESAGTGLGLYIAKKLINLHQGKIWLQSKVGEGSTFTFSLPLTVHEKN
ncbi:MAG: HAMP domain-containing sensor histidine kinase [Candidatus Shapirobacteria bacterium]